MLNGCLQICLYQLIAGQAEKNHIAFFQQRCAVRLRRSAGRRQLFQCGRHNVKAVHGAAAFLQQPPRHGKSHVSKADKSNVHDHSSHKCRFLFHTGKPHLAYFSISMSCW